MRNGISKNPLQARERRREREKERERRRIGLSF